MKPKTARKQAEEGPKCSRSTSGKVNQRKSRMLATMRGRKNEK